MKSLKTLLNASVAIAVACSMSACGGDDDEPGLPDADKGDWGGDVSAVDKITSDEDAKEYLGETASEVMDLFQPADQKPLVELASSFARDYEDYEFDYLGLEDVTPSRHALKRLFANLGRAASGNYMDLSRAAMDVIEVAPFTGVYNPDPSRRMFVRSAESDNVEVYFYHDGQPCKLEVRPSTSTWSVSGEIDGDDYTAKVPLEISFTLTEGATRLVNGYVNTYWKDGDALKVATDVTALNIRAAGSVNATNSVVTTTDEVYIDGTLLARAEGTVNGSNMVATKSIENLFDKEGYTYEYWDGDRYVTETEYDYDLNPSKLSKMFKNGTAKARLLDRVLVQTEVADASKLFNIEDFMFYSDDYDSSAQAKKACQSACDILNKYTTSNVFLAGNTKSTASIKWQPYLAYEYNWGGYGYQEWCPEGVIAFSDGSTYEVSHYGVSDFGNALNRFESLYYAYERMFGAAF